MLPKANRLKKKKDFDRVFKEGRGVKSGSLFFKYAPSALACTRFGFAVGQKVSKKAAVRNKIKRRLREIAKKKLPEIKAAIDGVVVAQKGTENLDFKSLNKLMEEIFKKAKLI
ncbi:MAG: ribonuclease P protein component [Candidatus Nealsonbacteria bacterium]|nr:ribonuclease P protein component [Candidatus Nealsonbacteria bacterium]